RGFQQKNLRLNQPSSCAGSRTGPAVAGFSGPVHRHDTSRDSMKAAKRDLFLSPQGEGSGTHGDTTHEKLVSVTATGVKSPYKITGVDRMKRLYRDAKQGKLAGVCAGLGEYLEIDPVVIRLIFVLLAFWGGAGVFVYIAAWILVPEKPA
ncbi:MAG: PspC domain-containing protein, partial [Fidelibacterota bacterium]